MKHLGPISVTAAWLLALGAGMAYLAAYDSTPGEAGRVPVRRKSTAAELVLFVHPQCPCARSALAVLGRLEPDFGRVRIVFVGHRGARPDWWAGRNWESAGERAERDEGGTIAHSYGVRTSGHAVLYDADGRLRFSGGVAPARSAAPEIDHQIAEWKRLLAESELPAVARPVFGCPLFDEAASD